MKTALEQQSVGVGVGIILTHLLDEARSCASHLNAGAINEVSLHDFRVSIRRLRVWCRTIDNDGLVLVPESCHTTLKNLVRRTNKARELDVHIDLLKKNLKGLSKSDKAAVSKIEKKWTRKVASSLRTNTRHIEKSFANVDADCIRVIAEIMREGAHTLLLSLWIGSVFAREAEGLDSQLKSVRSIDDEQKIHKARLRAKALRYLAESFVSESFEAQQLVDDLRDLQDVIGSLRDTQTLIARIEKSRKLTLPKLVFKRLRRREKILFKKFEKNYMKAPGFENKVQLLFASIIQTS